MSLPPQGVEVSETITEFRKIEGEGGFFAGFTLEDPDKLEARLAGLTLNESENSGVNILKKDKKIISQFLSD